MNRWEWQRAEFSAVWAYNPKEMRVWNAVLSYMMETVAKWDDKFRATCKAPAKPS